MTGYLEDARRAAFKAVGLQCLAGLGVAIMALPFGGFEAAEAVVLGALVGVGANLVLVAGVFAGKTERDPQRFLLRMMVGEMSKFAVATALFIVAIVGFKAAFLPLMAGYLATLIAYWVGLFKSNIGQMK